MLAVEKIKPNPWNPNELGPFMMEKLKKSLLDHGFTQEMVVREVGRHYEVIDGQHRLQAAQDLGMKNVPCLNMGKISDAEAKQLCEIFIHLHGQPDLVKEAALLRSLVEDDGLSLDQLKASLPFQDNELESLYRSLDFSWDDFKKEPGSGKLFGKLKLDADDSVENGVSGGLEGNLDTGSAEGGGSGESSTSDGSAWTFTGLSEEDTREIQQAVLMTAEESEEAALMAIVRFYIRHEGRNN